MHPIDADNMLIGIRSHNNLGIGSYVMEMNRRLRISIFGMSLVVWSVVGCSGSDYKKEIIGVWEYPFIDLPATGGDEFREDGTYRNWYSSPSLNKESTGTYVVNGKQVSITVTEETDRHGLKNQTNKSQGFTIISIDKGSMTITADHEVYTFKRKN
ncbi:MAG: hypothetical protein KF836_06550 [Fimbriimonadaceae bacterium]|nr:hypothetical protein [Fimbriimonadaceae bacterium]